MPHPLTNSELQHLTDAVDPAFTRINNRLSLVRTGGFSEQRFGSARAFQDVRKPKSTYYNRVVGLGEQDIPFLEEIESWYRQAGIDCVVSLPPHLQTTVVLDALRERNFWFWAADHVFYMRPEDHEPLSAPADVDVRLVTSSNAAALFDLMRATGSTIEDDVLPGVADLYCQAPMEFYIAFVDGQPVAMASVFFSEGVAWFNNAVTARDFRGQGCHTALLKVRIAAAQAKHCALIISDTEFGGASHRNLVRCGFQLGFVSAEFRKSFDQF